MLDQTKTPCPTEMLEDVLLEISEIGERMKELVAEADAYRAAIKKQQSNKLN